MNSSMIKKRIVPALSGVMILAFAIALLIKTKFGVSAWDAFYANLSDATGFTFGFFSYSVGFILIGLNSAVSRKKFNWSALVMSFLIGNGVDLFNKMFNGFNLNSMVSRTTVFIVGIIFYGLGIALLICSSLPSPLEEFQFSIRELFKVSIGTSKFYSDLSAFVMAVIVGVASGNGLGQISFGTLAITLVVGKVVGIWSGILDRCTGDEPVDETA